MNLAECYQLLGLKSGASFEDIKSSYRRLARRYHPDMSSGDQHTKDKFIEITTAYKRVLNALNDNPPDVHTTTVSQKSSAPGTGSTGSAIPKAGEFESRAPRRAVTLQTNPGLSALDQQLKVNSYRQLQQLLREQRFPRAIALVEGLARRIPRDSEISQWQAIVYQQWGRQLIRDRQPEKARTYLKKAISTDPHNRSLWAEVEKDFREIEQLF